MNVAISAIRTKETRINRHELVTSIQTLGHKVTYIGQDSESELHPDYKKLNVRFQSVPLGRNNTNPFKELKSIIETRKVLKRNNIEALIVYGIRTFPTMVIAARLAGVKKILCTVNGSGRLFQLSGIKGLLVKSISYPMLWVAFLLANNILFQNSDDMKMISSKKLLWRRNYGTVNGSGVNLEEFKLTELEKQPVFMMISRITGSKGVNEYLQAAQQVKQRYPKARFYLIGPMDDSDATIDQDLLQKLINEENIIIKGKVEDVRPCIQMTRVFVLPSYYPEGIPRSILEAMAMGRPVITTDTSGCKETVIEGVNGLLVPPKNSSILTKKMIWMIENNKRLDEMGKQSRIICENKFDVNNINNIMLETLGIISKSL